MENHDLKEKILSEIKKAKKYSNISDEVIMDEIDRYLKKYPKILKTNKFKKKNIQEIKTSLHRLYSGYQTNKKNKRDLYLEELNKNFKDKEALDKILNSAISTKERAENYDHLYEEIFNVTGQPKSIVDLGCGINPVSYPFMHLSRLDYHAYDIDKKDIDFLNRFFDIEKKSGLNGIAKILNVKILEKIKNIPDSDVVFMFKLIDLIDTKNKKISEPLIKILLQKTKFIVASFATKTMTGKRMFLPRRTGFELMLKRNDLDFKRFDLENELFYLISKKV